jgi:hypothetical protein
MNVRANVVVEHQHYFGGIPLSEVSGLCDELSGKTATSHFRTAFFTPEEIKRTWRPIQDPNDLAVRPSFTLRAQILNDTVGATYGHRSVAFTIDAPQGLKVEIETRQPDPF